MQAELVLRRTWGWQSLGNGLFVPEWMSGIRRSDDKCHGKRRVVDGLQRRSCL